MFYSLLISLFILIIIFCFVYFKLGNDSYMMDRKDSKNSFANILQVYIDIAKLIIGLSSGSIVLIIGLSFNKSNLLENYITPLYLLFMTIFYGILFIVFLTLDYESFNHNQSSYKKFKYARNITLGYSSLVCFLIGYFWLILTAVY